MIMKRLRKGLLSSRLFCIPFPPSKDICSPFESEDTSVSEDRSSIVYDISPLQNFPASLHSLPETAPELPSFAIDLGFDVPYSDDCDLSFLPELYPPTTNAVHKPSLRRSASNGSTHLAFHLPTRQLNSEANNLEAEFVSFLTGSLVQTKRIESVEAELAVKRRKIQAPPSSPSCEEPRQDHLETNFDYTSVNGDFIQPQARVRSSTIQTISTPASSAQELTPGLSSVPSISSEATHDGFTGNSPDMTWALDHNENYGLDAIWANEPTHFALIKHSAPTNTEDIEPQVLKSLETPPVMSMSLDLSFSSNSYRDAVELSVSPMDKDFLSLPPSRKRSLHSMLRNIHRRVASIL